MGTIKSYTDIEQSRKLAEILPLDSADGYRHPYDDGLSLSLDISNCMEVAADNEVDACVDMIMKLHENNVV